MAHIGSETQDSGSHDEQTQDAAALPPVPPLLTEDELALINALQLSPRASWTELGRALGVDPVTVARRFHRLSAQGTAWVGFSPGPRLLEQICVAYVVIDCAPGTTARVAEALSAHPHMVTIERTASGHDILATVAAPDLPALSRYALDLLPHLPGITAVRSRIVTHMFTEGGHWRIAALAPAQRARLTAQEPAPAAQRTTHRQLTPADRALAVRLAHDGRAPYQTLARDLGVSLSTAKRRVEALTRHGLLRFRCDFARPLGGWPVAVTFWARVPPADLPGVGQSLIRLPETRNCAAISGPQNLILQASLHSVSDILRLETHLATAHPALDIADRVVTLRQDKLLGRLLDPHGRSVGVVPADLWAEPAL
ncbi:Lrp/AsnC family transcriptional regulator [Streptomyces sp. Ag109_O5-10]|uniref:Lrp/AsnC family transcriptional regulator n=1 Tax=Streptomyces sp. Ag109_O5-10 TaxID=1855349 RepID=UPI00089B0AB9|nr:Lrp/AsnC family transcriptional regulator [Streptomyces sp. Ag109_O5-10]SEF07010.1 DNA-binding transcriptional regulator, Lrp family [Streptomyces sp. Ag109_O5-10]